MRLPPSGERVGWDHQRRKGHTGHEPVILPTTGTQRYFFRSRVVPRSRFASEFSMEYCDNYNTNKCSSSCYLSVKKIARN
jgi:hypothetical protein